MERVRVGIIGYGSQGGKYAREFFNEHKVENGDLVAICDIDENRLEAAKRELSLEGISYFKDYKEMIDSKLVDAVVVVVPHYFHPEMTIYGLEHGVHVLCEKPAGVYTKQVKEMNEVAKKSNKLFGMMFNQRTNCIYRKMRELVQSGEIGQVRRVNWIITNWYRPQAYYNSSSWRASWKGEGGGVLMNQCPHQIDLLYWVLGMLPSRISANLQFGKYHNIEVEDSASIYLEYANGATGSFITTTAECAGSNRFEIVGNNGKLLCENDKLFLTKLEMGEREYNATATSMFGEPKSTTVEVETDGKNLQHIGIFNNFVNAILGKEELFVSGLEGINSIEMIDAMLLSGFKGGKKVSLPIDDDEYLRYLDERRKYSGKVNKLKLCAFADEAGDSLDEQIAALKRNNISLLEIRSVDKKNVLDLSDEELKAIKAKLDEKGIKVWSIGSPIGKVDIKLDFDLEVNRFKRALEIAKILGAKNIRIFSFYNTSKDDKEEVIRRLKEFVKIAKGSGIDICHENEKDIYGEDLQGCLDIFENVEGLKMVFDPANFVFCGHDSLKAWKKLSKYVKYCHIKDATGIDRIVAAGEGIGGLPTILSDYSKFGKVVTLEPHLFSFTALSSLGTAKLKMSARFENSNESFDYATRALRGVLLDIGVKEE